MNIYKNKKLAILGTLIVFALSACGGGAGVTTSSAVIQTNSVLSKNKIKLVSNSTLGVNTWLDGSTSTGGRGAGIGGVSCLTNENYHTHAHLAIIKNGQMLAIPAHVGLQGCAYELHTHDMSGVVHIETDAYHKFTLGNFFAVWGQPLSLTNIAGIVNFPMAVYVNDGEDLVQFKGNIADIELTPHRSITIVLGDSVKEIPSYEWDASLN